MVVKRLILLGITGIAALSGGCGVAPFVGNCDVSDRTGFYLAEYREMSGDCGPIPDDVVWFNERGMRLTDMQVVLDCMRSQTVSEDECTVSAVGTCPGGLLNVWTQIETWQMDAEAKLLEGQMDVVATGIFDKQVHCTGSYGVSYRRQ